MRLSALGLMLAFALGLLVAPLAAEVQPLAKIARIGYLVIGALESPETRVLLDAFRQGLRDHGYVEGQNIVIEYRAADGQIERLPRLATELAHTPSNLVVAHWTADVESTAPP